MAKIINPAASASQVLCERQVAALPAGTRSVRSSPGSWPSSWWRPIARTVLTAGWYSAGGGISTSVCGCGGPSISGGWSGCITGGVYREIIAAGPDGTFSSAGGGEAPVGDGFSGSLIVMSALRGSGVGSACSSSESSRGESFLIIGSGIIGRWPTIIGFEVGSAPALRGRLTSKTCLLSAGSIFKPPLPCRAASASPPQ